MLVEYNPLNTYFKSVIGAVKEKEEFKIRIKLSDKNTCRLILMRDFDNFSQIYDLNYEQMEQMVLDKGWKKYRGNRKTKEK